MARIDEVFETDGAYLDGQVYALVNLAHFAAARGERGRAVGYLQHLTAADGAALARNHHAEELACLRNDPDFEAVFAGARPV